MLFDPIYMMMMAPVMLLAMWAQWRVKANFEKYSKVGNSSNMTGAEAAAVMVEKMGIRVVGSSQRAASTPNAVAIEVTQGFLSDHYDPRDRTLRLSPDVYSGRSLAAVGIACHEAGHALQHAHGYAMLSLRSLLVPTASFGSWLAFPVIFAGFALQAGGMIEIGIILFACVVLFQLVTLPVEFDASNRAKAALVQYGIIRAGNEQHGVAKVLNAAALTYVAAAISAVMTLLYYVWLYMQSQNRN
jgi:uncharacterized protein